MMIEPREQIRERERATVALNIRDCSGEIELLALKNHIALLGGFNRYNTLYSRTSGSGSWSEKDRREIVVDVIEGAARGRYSPSLTTRIALRLGYIPKKIRFQRN